MSRARLLAIAAVTSVAILGLLTASLTLAGGSARHAALRPARNFTLSVLGHPGRHLSLQSLRGRPVILNFFASWCAPCRKETPLLARFYASHRRPLIVGIDANDSRAGGLAFVRHNAVGYPVVADPFPGKTAIAYGLPGLPATFFLDSRHRIVRRIYGPVTPAELAAGAATITGHGS